jgi:hypothetical protein
MRVSKSRDTCSRLRECHDKISFILKGSVEAAGARVIESGVVRGLAILARSQGKLVIRFRRASECADRRLLNARLRHSFSPE